MNGKVNALVIRTPEGVTFSLLLAGPVTRCLAWLIDCCCVVTLLLFVQRLLSFFVWFNEDTAEAAMGISYFLIQIGYGMALEWHWRGQTVGKRLFNLRVMDEQGLRLQFSQIMLRNLLRFVDSLPLFYLVGGVSCLLSKRAQRLGDIAATTIVVRHPRVIEPDVEQLLAGKFNSFRAHPHLAARLRQRVSPREAAVALQALARRDEFEPAARVELFSGVAAHFKGLCPFPPEALEGLTDEQYVRNVVDILFSESKARGI